MFGSEQDPAKVEALQKRAFEYASKGCEAGIPRDCELVADHYAIGHGVAKDENKSAETEEPRHRARPQVVQRRSRRLLLPVCERHGRCEELREVIRVQRQGL